MVRKTLFRTLTMGVKAIAMAGLGGMGLSSKYNKNRWGFGSKERGGGRWMEITKREHQKWGG